MSAYRPFKCSICLNDYKDPKILSCFHSFCLECLKNCFETRHAEAIKCPLCRHLTPMPEDGVNGLSNNIYVEPSQGSSVQGKLYCGFCCSNFVAEFHCRDCLDYLCLNCKEQHTQMKQTKDHLLEIVEEEKPLRQDNIEMCPKHETKEILFACYQCSTECCSDCWNNDHADHKIGPLSEVAGSARQAVGEHVEETKNKLADMVKEQAEIMVHKDKISTLVEHTKTDIDNIRAVLKDRVDKVTENIISELTETGETLKQKLERGLDENENERKSISERIETTLDKLDSTSNINILKAGTDLKRFLITVNSKPHFRPQSPHVSLSNIEGAILSSLRDRSDTPAFNILHPTLECKIIHSIKLKTMQVTALVCLANGCILLCGNNERRLHQITVDGDRLGSFRTPFRVADAVQLGDGSILITKYLGKRVAKFWLDGNYVDNTRVDSFTAGIDLTHDGNDVILCCSDVKEERKERSADNGPEYGHTTYCEGVKWSRGR